MAEKKLTLIESFRTVLRATYSKRPALADEIQSNQYFHCIPINRDTGSRDHPEAQAASDAFDMLKNAIVGKQIRVCGCLDPNLPADIDPTEVTRTSDIHVFAGTIEVHRRGVTLRMYRNVHCYESEVAAITGSVPRIVAQVPKSHTRFVEDDSLVTDGIDGLRSSPPRWPNMHQAAISLAEGAKGPIDARISRIERKISKFLKTNQNTSKD